MQGVVKTSLSLHELLRLDVAAAQHASKGSRLAAASDNVVAFEGSRKDVVRRLFLLRCNLTSAFGEGLYNILKLQQMPAKP